MKQKPDKNGLFWGDCIRTASGIYVDVFKPTEDMITIEDIAYGLSHVCRWAGHTKKFYSVAQHSVCVSRRFSFLSDTILAMQALIHDASEAYIGDMPSPIKRKLSGYKKIEESLMTVIAAKFGIQLPLHPSVKEADLKELEAEHWLLMDVKDGDRINYDFCWSPERARQEFMDRYNQLLEQLITNGVQTVV